ncbi:Flp family type IVb pilin [Arthrobacter sp. NPDC056691]|uniref:Flp family type IVb pilin n=1 Tax=Arthrobacter sp. NPDC056691 TaxID=3345913 RepID=UPI00366AD255
MIAIFSNATARVRHDEKGATAVEYGIMVALIAVVIIVAVGLIGGNLTTTFSSVACNVKGGAYTAAKAADAAAGTAAVAESCTK